MVHAVESPSLCRHRRHNEKAERPITGLDTDFICDCKDKFEYRPLLTGPLSLALYSLADQLHIVSCKAVLIRIHNELGGCVCKRKERVGVSAFRVLEAAVIGVVYDLV